jgi:DNA-binding PadR family transcriptional regulator
VPLYSWCRLTPRREWRRIIAAKACPHLSANPVCTLEIEFGSLYPALKRLEMKGWITSKWETSEHNRRARYYRLTATGRKQLASEHSKWAEFVEAVARVMGPASGEVKG